MLPGRLCYMIKCRSVYGVFECPSKQAYLLDEDESLMKANYKIFALLAGAVSLVALGAAVSFWAFKQIEVSAQTRTHTSNVLKSADDLLSALKDAETGTRGYLLTGDESFLEPYLEVRDSFNDRLNELRQLTLGSATYTHVEALAPIVDARLTHLARTIELYRNNNVTAAIENVRGGEGKGLMDSVRIEIRSINQIEGEELARNEAEFVANMRFLFIVIAFASLFVLLLALSFAYLIYREMQQRLKNVVHLQTQRFLEIQNETNKQLEQANTTLRVSEENLWVTLNSIGDAVIATDAEGHDEG
jgi:two-component system sensor histidine kinase EvgS